VDNVSESTLKTLRIRYPSCSSRGWSFFLLYQTPESNEFYVGFRRGQKLLWLKWNGATRYSSWLYLSRGDVANFRARTVDLPIDIGTANYTTEKILLKSKHFSLVLW